VQAFNLGLDSFSAPVRQQTIVFVPTSRHCKLRMRGEVAFDESIHEHSPFLRWQGRRLDGFPDYFGYGRRLGGFRLLTCSKQQDAAYRKQQRAEKFATTYQGESPAEMTGHSINVLRRHKKRPRWLPGPVEAIFQRSAIADPVT
jgi:hypothetical protein